MTETVELKNCPFCGGTDQVDATMEGKVQFETFVSAASVMAVKVVCACGASGRGFIERPDGYIQAAKFWNTRSDPAVRDRVTDEMVEAAMSAFIAAVRQQDKEWTDDIDEEQLLTSPSGDWFAPFYPIRDALTAALRTSPPEPASGHPDDVAVDRFAEAMKAKLAKKRAEGRGGWDDKDDCSAGFLSQLLRDHVEKGDPLDVGNLSMMLHQRGERIVQWAAL